MSVNRNTIAKIITDDDDDDKRGIEADQIKELCFHSKPLQRISVNMKAVFVEEILAVVDVGAHGQERFELKVRC